MLLASVIKNKYIKIAGIIILAVFVLAISGAWLLLSQKGFYTGIRIEGISLAGLGIEEAKAVLENKSSEILSTQSIALNYKSKQWVIKPKEIRLSHKLDESIEKAYKMGREGNFFSRAYTVLKLRFSNVNFTMETQYDRSYLYRKLDDIKRKIDAKGKDAYLSYADNQIKINKEKIGIQLDIDKNMKLVENHIVQGDTNAIELIVDEKKPAVLYEDIKDIDTVLSSFSTVFNPNDSNRTQNLKLSCSRINGIILLPGEIFSMNKVLGPRTIENGYKEAKIIIKSEYVNGVGGGVCQITTTLYDAVLLSRLKVVERYHHSLPSVYVGPGQDATIAENYLDFKFENDSRYPIYINAEVEKSKINIRILGKESTEHYKVKLVSQVLEEYPPQGEDITVDDSIPDNREVIVQHPKNGCRAVLYREILNSDGELIDKEKISEDVYKPIKAEIKVNSNHVKASMVAKALEN